MNNPEAIPIPYLLNSIPIYLINIEVANCSTIGHNLPRNMICPGNDFPEGEYSRQSNRNYFGSSAWVSSSATSGYAGI